MDPYVMKFNQEPYGELDSFALLACQAYNFGNETDWFGTFRGGLYGFYSRLYGAASLFEELYAWNLKSSVINVDSYAASILFNMDSAVECLTFALNALGFAARPELFHDVTDAKALRKINPENVMGNLPDRSKKAPVDGYGSIFPGVQSYWQSRVDLISRIMDLHDVSKHRQTVYSGGSIRGDPPAGFFEHLGWKEGDSRRVLLSPPGSIILRSDPKAPRGANSSESNGSAIKHETLEVIAKEFQKFIDESGRLALLDARENIALAYDEFVKADS